MRIFRMPVDHYHKLNRLSPVSRETFERLERYVDLLMLWNQRINLVRCTDVAELWERHLLDAAQLLPYLPASGHLIDMGSGGGIPGAVLAILAPSLSVTLIESDQRKASFLREVSLRLASNITVCNGRVEAYDGPAPDWVTARALAPLSDLLALSRPLAGPHTSLLFPKGREYENEIKEALHNWDFNYTLTPSWLQKDAAIITIPHFRARHG